jgi:glucose/arabinose dehydrogenase
MRKPKLIVTVSKKISAAAAKAPEALFICACVLPLALLLSCARPAPTATQTDASSPPLQVRSARLEHHEIKVESLPPARATRDADNPPIIIAQPAGAQLTLPPGFEIKTFAEGGFERPRWMALAPNGDVFVADADAGSVIILRGLKEDGTASERFTFTTGLNKPFGMGFWRDYFYVCNTDAVVRFRYRPGQTQAEGGPEKITDLPGSGYREHWTRNILFNSQGTKMYVTVGSATDVDVEPEPRGAILELNPDGSGRRIYADGLRNPIGLAFRPGSGALWAAVQERDHLGDDLVPDFVTEIHPAGFYGWPYSYSGRIPDPRRTEQRPDLAGKAIVPDVLIQAHSAILGLAFYDGQMFPQEYRGDAFVALHGSWNRAERTGYKIIRIRFKDGKPVGGYDDFIAGWMINESQPEVWGRPVGLLVLPDGSLLISEDGAKKIWRVTYRQTDKT